MKPALTSNERILVEAIRKAPRVQILIPGYAGKSGETRITVVDSKFSHDVALSLQSYYVNAGRLENRELLGANIGCNKNKRRW